MTIPPPTPVPSVRNTLEWQPTLTPLSASYAVYVDPTLRLKLEFAGYTLAEGAAMRLETGERTDGQTIDGTGASYSSTAITGGQTVADLPPSEVRVVARSLGLGGVITSTFTISPAGFGEIRAPRLALMASQVNDAFNLKQRLDPEKIFDSSFLPTKDQRNIFAK